MPSLKQNSSAAFSIGMFQSFSGAGHGRGRTELNCVQLPGYGQEMEMRIAAKIKKENIPRPATPAMTDAIFSGFNDYLGSRPTECVPKSEQQAESLLLMVNGTELNAVNSRSVGGRNTARGNGSSVCGDVSGVLFKSTSLEQPSVPCAKWPIRLKPKLPLAGRRGVSNDSRPVGAATAVEGKRCSGAETQTRRAKTIVQYIWLKLST
ncbi:hypothetical protein B0T13DRAFT_4964 [Neurospora crassa]|nr:hypothetical protein B0T13DRAFT_4964 [Neurospora crassa]